jgi:hypothetical protein
MPGIIENIDEGIVISGISGRFPESANFKEFQENLFNHTNMVTVNERRFKPGLYGIPEGFGTLKELDKFDAEFFKILPNQAQRMDPQLRLAMETTYESIIDAGMKILKVCHSLHSVTGQNFHCRRESIDNTRNKNWSILWCLHYGGWNFVEYAAQQNRRSNNDWVLSLHVCKPYFVRL